MKTLFLLVPLAPFIVPHAAFTSPAAAENPEVYRRSFGFAPAVATAGPVSRGGAVDLNGDSLPDGVVLDGDRVLYLECIEAHDVLFDTELIAQDVATLPTGGGEGAGSLLMVNATGLVHAKYRISTRDFAATPLIAGSWVSAQRVVTADLDGLNMLDAVGVDSSGNILVSYSQSSSSVSFGAPSSFTPLQAPLDLAVVEWDGLPGAEIAVLGLNGIEVYAQSGGAPLASIAAGSGRRGRAGIAVVKSGTNEGVAWVSTGSGQFLLHHSTSSVSLTTIDLLGMNIVALAAADVDLDGADELFASRKDAVEVTRLGGDANLGFSVTSGVVSYLVGAPGTNMAANVAVPILADIDLDSDPDLVFVNEPAGEVWVHRGEYVLEDDQRVAVGPDPLYSIADPAMVYMSFVLPSVVPSGVTHLETRIWHLASLEGFVNPDVLNTTRVPVGPFDTEVDQELELITGGGSQFIEQVFFFETRLVEMVGTDVVHRWPAVSHTFSANPTARAAMLNTPHFGEEIVVTKMESSGPGEGGGTTKKGGSGNYPPGGPPPEP